MISNSCSTSGNLHDHAGYIILIKQHQILLKGLCGVLWVFFLFLLPRIPLVDIIPFKYWWTSTAARTTFKSSKHHVGLLIWCCFIKFFLQTADRYTPAEAPSVPISRCLKSIPGWVWGWQLFRSTTRNNAPHVATPIFLAGCPHWIFNDVEV